VTSSDPMNPHLTVNGRRFDKVHLILNPDVSNAGFCALITYALNGVRLALENNWLPVVNFDRENCPFFYDAEHGDNVWEYYFEPVFHMTYAELRRLIASGQLSDDLVHTYPWRDLLKWHHSDPERIATFWAADVPENPAEWMKTKRQLGRRYVAEYIRVKTAINAKVDAFVGRFIKGTYTFGAHVRGTDFAYAEPTPPDAYFRAIEELVRQRALTDFRVFLATDQKQFVDLFRQAYGPKLLTYDSLRSSGEVAPFRLSGVSPYKKGEDVLMDVLLLSRCDHVLKCAAAGGEYALWFNPDLQCTDFALGSRFDTRKYHRLESAFLKLNISKVSPAALKIRRFCSVCDRYLRNTVVAKLARRGGRFGRRLLRRLAG
jgi:hypothetical protein